MKNWAARTLPIPNCHSHRRYRKPGLARQGSHKLALQVICQSSVCTSRVIIYIPRPGHAVNDLSRAP